MEHDTVLVRREPPLGWLVLNRPEVRNALNLQTWSQIGQGMDALEADSQIRVVILRGVGSEAFISGADISEFKHARANAEQARDYPVTMRRATAALVNASKPVLAMIAGVCMGGGVHVALSCDIRIVAHGTRFAIPAARLGLAYGLEAVVALVQTVGQAHARDILLSARTFDAQEALAMGLVHRLVDVANLEDVVRQYATAMAANAPLTMAAAKSAIREAMKDPDQRDQKSVDALIARCFNSEDYREGVLAFAQKRRPQFSGR